MNMLYIWDKRVEKAEGVMNAAVNKFIAAFA